MHTCIIMLFLLLLAIIYYSCKRMHNVLGAITTPPKPNSIPISTSLSLPSKTWREALFSTLATLVCTCLIVRKRNRVCLYCTYLCTLHSHCYNHTAYRNEGQRSHMEQIGTGPIWNQSHPLDLGWSGRKALWGSEDYVLTISSPFKVKPKPLALHFFFHRTYSEKPPGPAQTSA